MKLLELHKLIREELRILREEISLEPVSEKDSDFGKSYSSKLGSSKHNFFSIKDNNDKIGEIEYSDIDKDSFELISIHINSKFRKMGYGKKAYNSLVNKLNKKVVILKAAPSSVKFWKSLGFEKGEPGYLIKKY